MYVAPQPRGETQLPPFNPSSIGRSKDAPRKQPTTSRQQRRIYHLVLAGGQRRAERQRNAVHVLLHPLVHGVLYGARVMLNRKALALQVAERLLGGGGERLIAPGRTVRCVPHGKDRI